MENYEIVTNIGKGSSGAVFLARSLISKRLVAIKKIEIDENRRSKSKKSVVREASILRRLVHPYIVECEEWFLDGEEKLMHIVLEYCNGGTMQDLVRLARHKKSYFPEEKVLKWMVQIVSAVAFMHSKRILHRDLKTENVFIVKPDTAKLGDFGISKEIDHTLDMAQTCVGTPCYLSPELCQDIPYSSKSDVWALGCLLFEMAALKPAFDAANLISLFYKIVKGDFAELPKECSKNMLEIITTILQKDPNKRPSAAKLLEHPTLAKYASDISSGALTKNRKSAIRRSPAIEEKRPPKLGDLRDKSGNVEEVSSFENHDTITNDRTLSPGPSYAYNMFLSGVKAKSTLSSSNVLPPIPASNNRAVSVLGVGKEYSAMAPVPKLFADGAEAHDKAASPPPQEVETARPQTCPHSASRTRTEPVEEETFTDTVVTWSGYGDRGSRHRSGRRHRDSISLSSGTDESSDSEIETERQTARKCVANGKYHHLSDSSNEGDISEEIAKDDANDDDIPEVIEDGDELSGDSTHTGDEQAAGDNGRILPGSAWLRSKRTQVLQRKQAGTTNENKTQRKKKMRLPGSSWLSKEQRVERERANSETSFHETVVLGEKNSNRDVSLERRKGGSRYHRNSGKIRNLPGSAWLKNSRSPKPVQNNSPRRHDVPNATTNESSMVVESFSSSGNERSGSEKRQSESDCDYGSDYSYPDDFEDYEDDFEFSDDELSSDDDRPTIQSKSSLDVVKQGCIDYLGEKVFKELSALFNKGLSFPQALNKMNSKEVDTEALEACYLLLQKK